MRELWTDEPTNSKNKITRERQIHIKKEVRIQSHLMRFVDLICRSCILAFHYLDDINLRLASSSSDSIGTSSKYNYV